MNFSLSLRESIKIGEKYSLKIYISTSLENDKGTIHNKCNLMNTENRTSKKSVDTHSRN